MDMRRHAALLKEKGIDTEVINLHTIKPIDKEAVAKSVQKTGAVVTVDNHNVAGGIGTAIAEALAAEYPVRMCSLDPQDLKGEVGKMAFLKERFGMTACDIAAACEKMVTEKRGISLSPIDHEAQNPLRVKA